MIEIEYRFEEVQNLKFMVYDLDNATSRLDDDDFLGCIQCTLGEVSTASLQKICQVQSMQPKGREGRVNRVMYLYHVHDFL